MIARLHGRVVAVETDAVVLDVGGVGYRVHVPLPVLGEAGPPGATLTLHTHLHLRENEVALYGTVDEASLDLFRLLLGVAGVGPKVALAMLSTFEPMVLQQAIVAEDITLLSQVPGIGRKTAQRIVLELKGRLEALGMALGPTGGPVARVDQDAVAALVGLGYSAAEAHRALVAAEVAPEATLEDRILAALRLLGRG